MRSDNNHTLPPELRARLEQEDPADLEALEHVWQLMGKAPLSAEDVPEADETWQMMQQRLRANREAAGAVRSRKPTARPPRPRRRRRTAASRWVGAAVIFALLTGGLLFWRQPVHVAAPAGQRVAHTLPDGSTVELSSGSTLTYRRDFLALPFWSARQRSVSVEGGAFFEVERRERPFVVETFNARVEVLGTAFDVQAWSQAERPETQVTLASGRVRFAALGADGEPVILQEAGQSSHVVDAGSAPTPPEEVDLDQALAWRRHGFYASDQPLSMILDRLERRYGTRLALQVPSVAADSMTLFYAQKTDLETILNDICMAKDLTYHATSRGYQITRRSRAGD